MDGILTWIWQGTLIALLVPAVVGTTRLNASTRYGICWLALVSVVLLPCSDWIRAWIAAPAEVTASPGADHAPITAFVLPPAPAWFTAVLVAAWLCWFVWSAARIVCAARLMQILKGTCVPVSEQGQAGLPLWQDVRSRGRRARLCLSDAIKMPAALGFSDPLIVLPRHAFDTLTLAEIDQIVLHEYAHVQRRDDWGRLVQTFLQALCGWHPGVLRLNRSLELERELACDEWVVARTRDAVGYADCLTRIAAGRLRPTGLRLAPGLFEAGALTRRVHRLLTGDSLRPASLSRSQLVLAAMLLAAGIITFKAAAPVLRTDVATAVLVEESVPRGSGEPAITIAPRRPAEIVVRSVAAPGPKAATVRIRHTRARTPGIRQPAVREATVAIGDPVESPGPLASFGASPIGAIVAAPSGAELVTARGTEASDESPGPDSREDRHSAALPRSPATPWSAAAAASVAAASGLARAGVQSGGFFTRVGRSIADAF